MQPASDVALSRRVVAGTLSNYVGKFVTVGSGLLLTPFFVHRLGSADFGLWVLVGSVMGYGALLDFGIADAIIKYVAEYRAKGQVGQAHALVATALRLYAALGVVALVLSGALAPLFPLLFNVPSESRPAASWLFLLSGFTLGLSIPGSSTTAVLRGLQRYDVVNSLAIAGTLVWAAASVAVLQLGGGLIGLAITAVVSSLVMQIPTVWCIRRIAPELHFGWQGARRAAIWTVISFSSSLSIIHLAGRIQTRTDEIVIGKFLPLTAVTPYALADRLSQVPQMLTDQFVKVLVPLASELHAHDDLERLRFVYLAASRLTLAIFLPIGSIFIILAGPILAIWVGSEYADAGLIVAILTVASLFETSQWPAMALLQGVGRHHPLARMWVGAAVANLALSIVLVHTSLGVVGVALGTLVPTTVVCSAFVLPYAMRTLGVDLRQIASQVVWPAVRPAIPAAATLWLIHQAVQPMPLVGTILASAWTVCLYAVLYFVLGATALERHLLHDARLGMGRLVHAVVTHD